MHQAADGFAPAEDFLDPLANDLADGVARMPGSAAGLRERRTSGNKSPLGAAEKQALVALVEAGPGPAVHKVVRWRRVDLQKELKTRFGVEVHERTVGKYLAALGYRRLSVRPQHPEADPQAQEAF